MSSEITESLKQQYHDYIEMGLQQMGSRFRPAVRVESVQAKYGYFDRVEAVDAVLKTTRHADTPQIDTPHTRRRVDMSDYHVADLIDKQDVLRIAGNPENVYVQTHINALGRQMDDVIITAATGTAYEGETEVTSSDYNTVKAFVQGEVDTFMGFTFIRFERLAKASTTRSCLAWSRSGLLLAVGMDIMTDISERKDKSLATQVYACATFGATRMYEEKVVEIQCTESA